MISTQGDIVKVIATIQAHVLISSKKRTIGKGRFFTRFSIHLTLARNNAVEGDNGLFTGDSRIATTNPEDLLTVGPVNQLSSLQTDGLLPTQPFHGSPGSVNSENPQRHNITLKLIRTIYVPLPAMCFALK